MEDTFNLLSTLDSDLRILYLNPDPNSLKLRNKGREKRGESVRWSFDSAKVAEEHSQLVKWAKSHRCGMWDLARLVDLPRVDKKEGSADDSDLKKWRIAFPAPMSIGWHQEGTDPEVDALLTQWLSQLDKTADKMVRFVQRFTGDFSKSRWRHYFDVYDPKLGQLTSQIWDLAEKKGFEQKRRAEVLDSSTQVTHTANTKEGGYHA
jgi:hypothetical protein